MSRAFAKLAFTPDVLAEQERHGSANGYAKFLEGDEELGASLGMPEREFIAERDGFYQATTSETNWPYVQFRGGRPGFLKVLDNQTIAYADFRGNRQYLSLGNMTSNNRISLILMDYVNQRRLKIWGRSTIITVKDDEKFVNSLHQEGYRANLERAVVIHVNAFDWNCPQHIPRRYTIEEVEVVAQNLLLENARLKSRIDELEKAGQ